MHKKENTTKKSIIKIFFLVIGIIILLGTAVFSAYLIKSNGNIIDATLNIVTDVVGEPDPIFFLILGISEDISIELTDTIILGCYNPKSQKAFMISIPRDTYVGKNVKKASGNDKINSLIQKDYENTISAVEKITGITVDYYVIVKTTAVVEIVDSIGGVTFKVPIDMNYDDKSQNLHIHLNSGLQVLNGNQAEGLLRFRHNNNGTSYPISYGDNDFGRMRTQREFLKELAKQIINVDNIPKIKEISTSIFNNLKTDMSLDEILSYIPYGVKFDVNNLVTEQLPGNSTLINGLWFYKVDYEKSSEMIFKLIKDMDLDSEFITSHYRKVNN